MEDSENDLELHVFVCTNQKANKESCAPRGAEKIRAELKDWAKSNPQWKGKIRINASGCLDRCKEGVAIAMYPQDKWLVNVEPDDLDGLKATIEELMAEAAK
jgi:(2Fe-2S) ferredoxin